MSLAHAKKQTVRTSLGIWWTVIRDIVYIAVMITFRYLLSGNRQVENMHFIVHLVLALIPWFFMNEVINGGVNSFRMNKPIVKGIQFPVTILPTIEVTAIFLKRLFTFLFPIIVLLVFEDLSKINLLLILYYFFAMYLLMVVYNMFFSAFMAVSKDFLQLYGTISRVLMFFLPILWSYERLDKNPLAMKALKCIPFSYIMTGFRQAFMGAAPPTLFHIIVFYSFILVMFIAGCRIQKKFSKHYADFI